MSFAKVAEEAKQSLVIYRNVGPMWDVLKAARALLKKRARFAGGSQLRRIDDVMGDLRAAVAKVVRGTSANGSDVLTQSEEKPKGGQTT